MSDQSNLYSSFRAARPQDGDLVSYVVIHDTSLDDLFRSVEWGLAPLTAEEKVISSIKELQHHSKHLIIVIYFFECLTVGYAHMVSSIKPREELPKEFSTLPLPPHWTYVFKIKWIRISCLSLGLFSSLHEIEKRLTAPFFTSFYLVSRETATVICNLMDLAVVNSRNKTPVVRSITIHETYEAYIANLLVMLLNQVKKIERREGKVLDITVSSDSYLPTPTRKFEREEASEHDADSLKRFPETWIFASRSYSELIARHKEATQILLDALDNNRVNVKMVEDILRELLPFFYDLCLMENSWMLCKRLIQVTVEQPLLLRAIGKRIKGSIATLATHPWGSHVILQGIENFPKPGRELIARELLSLLEAQKDIGRLSPLLEKLLEKHDPFVIALYQVLFRHTFEELFRMPQSEAVLRVLLKRSVSLPKDLRFKFSARLTQNLSSMSRHGATEELLLQCLRFTEHLVFEVEPLTLEAEEHLSVVIQSLLSPSWMLEKLCLWGESFSILIRFISKSGKGLRIEVFRALCSIEDEPSTQRKKEIKESINSLEEPRIKYQKSNHEPLGESMASRIPKTTPIDEQKSENNVLHTPSLFSRLLRSAQSSGFVFALMENMPPPFQNRLRSLVRTCMLDGTSRDHPSEFRRFLDMTGS